MMADMTYTIPAFLAKTVADRADELALGTIRDGQLRWRTWREVWSDAQALTAVLGAAGIEPGERVAQVSENRYEWIVTDLALHLAGAVHVPIHVTLSGQQIAEQIADCGARLVFVSSEELLARFVGRLEAKTQAWIHDELAMAAKPQADGVTSAEFSLFTPRSSLLASPDDLATILYTSGTTGRPRGVMLSQRNLATNAAAAADLHGAATEQIRLNILPLCHIYARTCDLYTWVYRGSRLVLAESRATLLRDCRLALPTALSAVPYVYQRIADGVRASGTVDQAAALRAAFGGRMERLTCGGAALAPEYETWYAERGLPVTCGYGLSEASPVVTMSTLTAHRAGCVGRPLPGVDLRLAEDGEILVRSPGVMLGYWQDDAATAEAIRNGWLHTGDLGELVADGYLKIIGRKKEMIVLSTGKKVSPTRVENLLTASPLVEQAAVFGEGRPGLVALIVSNATACGSASTKTTNLGDQLAAEISRCLAAVAREEQVRAFAIIDRPFSIERGELTPKLSLCRAVIAANFADELTKLIQGEQAIGSASPTRSGVAAGAK
jgi:long-chain acyl-CoA synthetase